MYFITSVAFVIYVNLSNILAIKLHIGLHSFLLKYTLTLLFLGREILNSVISVTSLCLKTCVLIQLTPYIDIRELIQVDDVMEDDSLRFGPNGGLIFCMEYFANNFDWLEESLGHVEDDYILFDCPGKR